MQIVIDIPETMIQELKDGCFGAKHTVYELAGCIMNGTPLPPHGRLIDADAFRNNLKWNENIDNAPTILEATKGEE